MLYSFASPILPILQPVCTGIEIVFGGTSFGGLSEVTENNIGGRNNNLSPAPAGNYAMITNVGSIGGQPFHLKLESATSNGIDPNCKEGSAADHKACSIAINSSYNTVDFFIAKNEEHPIKFTFIDASTGSQILGSQIDRFSFSVFDVGNTGGSCELDNAAIRGSLTLSFETRVLLVQWFRHVCMWRLRE